MLEVPGLDQEEGQVLSHSNLHPKPTTRGLVHIREHPWVLGQATGTWTHLTHHGPDSGEATTFPHIVYSALFRGGYIRMAFCPGTPKVESQNYPGLDFRDFGRSPRPLIGTRSRPMLQLSSRAFQHRIALPQRTSGAGRFPTFSGRESNCQFDSRP